jgi:hypothetical protein
MYSSQSQPLNDQYRQSDVVPLWPTAEEVRDPDAGHRLSDRDEGIAPQESDPSELRAEQSSHASFYHSDFKSDPVTRPSMGRRISRTLGRFCIAVLIGVGSTLAWQSHGDDAKDMVRRWAPSLGWLLPVSTTRSASDQVVGAPAVTSPELVQQLEPMARNIARVLFNLEQLSAKQEQLAQNIAALQAVEQDRQMTSSPPPPRAAPLPPRRPPQLATQPPAVQPSSVSAAPLPTRSPLPLR